MAKAVKIIPKMRVHFNNRNVNGGRLFCNGKLNRKYREWRKYGSETADTVGIIRKYYFSSGHTLCHKQFNANKVFQFP